MFAASYLSETFWKFPERSIMPSEAEVMDNVVSLFGLKG